MVPHESWYSHRVVLQIQINKVMFHYRGAIKKGCNPEKEHHVLVELFLKSTNTSFFISWSYITVKNKMIYLNIRINFH